MFYNFDIETKGFMNNQDYWFPNYIVKNITDNIIELLSRYIDQDTKYPKEVIKERLKNGPSTYFIELFLMNDFEKKFEKEINELSPFSSLPKENIVILLIQIRIKIESNIRKLKVCKFTSFLPFIPMSSKILLEMCNDCTFTNDVEMKIAFLSTLKTLINSYLAKLIKESEEDKE